MGVPAFFRWLSKKYSAIVVHCHEEKVNLQERFCVLRMLPNFEDSHGFYTQIYIHNSIMTLYKNMIYAFDSQKYSILSYCRQKVYAPIFVKKRSAVVR